MRYVAATVMMYGNYLTVYRDNASDVTQFNRLAAGMTNYLFCNFRAVKFRFPQLLEKRSPKSRQWLQSVR